MIRQTSIVYRLPHLTRAQFDDYWRKTHAPLIASVAEVLGIREYVQLCPVDDHSPLAKWSGLPCDGIALVSFDSAQAVVSCSAVPEAREAIALIREDEERFIDRARTTIIWGTEREIIRISFPEGP
jgi:uncharacterized protein (TIGR02118 family)